MWLTIFILYTLKGGANLIYIVYILKGVANLVGPPFAGWLYDYTKEWFLTFGMAGLFIGIENIIFIIRSYPAFNIF